MNGWNFVLEKKLPRLSVNYVLNFVFGNRFEKLRKKSEQTLKIFFLKNKTIFSGFWLSSLHMNTANLVLGYKTPSQILEDSHHLLWKLANKFDKSILRWRDHSCRSCRFEKKNVRSNRNWPTSRYVSIFHREGIRMTS